MTDISALVEIAKQIPALIVLAWVVYQGINYNKSREESAQKTHEIRDGIMKEISKECHDAHQQLFEQLNDTAKTTTEQLARNNEMLGKIEMALTKLNGR